MAIYDGELHAYWEQGWEGRIEYAVAIEGQPRPFFLTTGQHLTIYAEDGSVLWQGVLRFVSRGREQHSLPYGIWSDFKQQGVPYGRWIAWFVHQPPLRAVIRDDRSPMELAQGSLPAVATVPPQNSISWIGRGMRLGAAAGAGLASLYALLVILFFGLLLAPPEANDIGDALVGFGAIAICAGPFALILGILPAVLIGALIGFMIGLVCLPIRLGLTRSRGVLIGLVVTFVTMIAVNVIVGRDLLRDETSPDRIFAYLFWLGAPSLLAPGGGAWVGWMLAREMQR